MTKPEELPPLQLEIDWDRHQEEASALGIGVIAEAEFFDVAFMDDTQGSRGIGILFPKERKGLLFEGEALEKLLFVFDTILHSMLESETSGVGEAPKAKTKVTLH